MNTDKTSIGNESQPSCLGAVIGSHMISETSLSENDYIELMFDNSLTTKRHWTISILNETTMIKPVYWRACR